MIRRVVLLLVLLGLVVAFSACGDDDDEVAGGDQEEAVPPEEVGFTFDGSAYAGPESIEAEPVVMTLSNESDQKAPMFVARLNEGVTLDDLMKAKEQEIFQLIVPSGSLPNTNPGEASTVTIELPEGQYIALNPDAGPEIAPASFEVVTATGPEVEAPEADAEVQAGDFFFEIPPTIPAGEVTLALENVGDQGHEFVLSSKDNKGGGFALFPAPGGTLWTTFNLEPGTYTAVCHFPDRETGKPHLKLGMKAEFTVE